MGASGRCATFRQLTDLLRTRLVPILAVVLVSAVLVTVVGVAVYLVGGGVSRRVAWQEQARVIFWDGERPEGEEPDL